MPVESIVISLGGSIIAPTSGPNAVYISALGQLLKDFFSADRRFFLICGGGGITRLYQDSAKENLLNITKESLDWIGIRATHINAEFARGYFGKVAYPKVLTEYDALPDDLSYSVYLGGGWKPGWSTDYVSVRCAELLKTLTVINLTNTPYVYDSDPNENPNAQAYETLSWTELIKKVGTQWSPGMRAPFDPIASQKASELGLKVIIAEGLNLENLRLILEGQHFSGTTIG